MVGPPPKSERKSKVPEEEKESSNAPAPEVPKKRPRGFAAMDRAVVSEIARKGGKSAHEQGTAHEFTSETAQIAGRKGGRATATRKARGKVPAND